MMRRIIAIILVVGLLSASITSSAVQSVSSSYDKNGLHDSANVDKAMGIDSMAIEKSISNGDIIQTIEGNYYTRIDDGRYIPTRLVHVDIDCLNESRVMLLESGIPEYSVRKLEDIVAEQVAFGNSNLEINYYITETYPVLLKNSANIAKNTSSGNVVETYTVEIRNYEGPFRDIKTGVQTKDIASSIYNFVISSVGVASTSVSLFGVGLSALSAYETAVNRTVSVGKPADYLQVAFKLDYLEKTSQLVTSSGLRMTGCVSQKIWIDNASYRQVYASISSTKQERTVSVNQTYTTKHWNNSAQTALYNYTSPVIDPDITIKLGNYTYSFAS